MRLKDFREKNDRIASGWEEIDINVQHEEEREREKFECRKSWKNSREKELSLNSFFTWRKRKTTLKNLHNWYRDVAFLFVKTTLTYGNRKREREREKSKK